MVVMVVMVETGKGSQSRYKRHYFALVGMPWDRIGWLLTGRRLAHSLLALSLRMFR